MKPELLDILRCPQCQGIFNLKDYRTEGKEIIEGVLTSECGQSYPIIRTIPRILPDAYTEYCGKLPNRGIKFTSDNRFKKLYQNTRKSFGMQWMTFEVQNFEEDKATFVAKTGFSLEEMRNQWVLDAGCGGGRYAYITAKAGAQVVAIDLSQAVEKTHELLKEMENIHIIQANLVEMPLKEEMFDFIYSIGVLHHTPNPREAFFHLIKYLKPGGKISIWVYPKWSISREWVNNFLRSISKRLPYNLLYFFAYAAVPLGFAYLKLSNSKYAKYNPLWMIMKIFAAYVPFSHHPSRKIRVCDTFDWYSPEYQWHHTDKEVEGWFRDFGLKEINNLSINPHLSNQGLGRGINWSGTKPG